MSVETVTPLDASYRVVCSRAEILRAINLRDQGKTLAQGGLRGCAIGAGLPAVREASAAKC